MEAVKSLGPEQMPQRLGYRHIFGAARGRQCIKHSCSRRVPDLAAAACADWCCRLCRLEHEYLAAYITELALPEYSALQWLPSCIAAAAVLLARHACAAAIPALRCFPTWSPTLEHYTRYTCAWAVLCPCSSCRPEEFWPPDMPCAAWHAALPASPRALTRVILVFLRCQELPCLQRACAFVYR